MTVLSELMVRPAQRGRSGTIVKGSNWVAAAIGTVFVAPCVVGESPTQVSAEHAVIVHFSYSSTDLSRLSKLEQKLTEQLLRPRWVNLTVSKWPKMEVTATFICMAPTVTASIRSLSDTC